MSTFKITIAEEKKSTLRDALEQLRETQALQFELVELANPAPGDEAQEATNNPGITRLHNNQHNAPKLQGKLRVQKR